MTGNQQHEASSSQATASDPWVGRVVGERYRIEERIGQGGMGVVYRGRHLELGKRVAIKRLDPEIAGDPISFERFRREAIAASRIESPHVVHVFDWGKADDGSPYLVMELLEGSCLRELLQREGRLLVDQAAIIVGQILRALIRTHQAQIIHRDLKPENVFLCRYDSDELTVKLLDFGISKRTSEVPPQENVTRRGVILGTASYMSPEQARGAATLDTRSDLYSVGAILYEALTGGVPHLGRTYEATLIDICTRDADDVRLHAPLVPEPVARVVARALQRDVAMRFRSAREFLDALTAAVPDLEPRMSEHPASLLAPLLPTTTGSRTVSPAATRTKDQPKTTLIWVISLLVAALAASWLVLRDRKAAPAPSAVITTTLPTLATAPSTPGTSPAASELPAATNSLAPARNTSARVATSPSLGGNSGRTTLHRQSAATSVPRGGPSEAPGVAGELKLRRTMP
jgi:eukaryotic-like serine/threonine-protein kinase